MRPTPARFSSLEDELVDRLISLQRRFDAGEWSGTEALEYVRESRAVRLRLAEELGLSELDIEIAVHERSRRTTP